MAKYEECKNESSRGGSPCDQECRGHIRHDHRLAALEDKLTVVSSNNEAVNKLTARVGLLVTLMSLGTVTVIGGAVYTFTALSQFRGEYAEHRLLIERQLNGTQTETLDKLSSKIEGLERRLDARLDTLSNKMVQLESTVKRNN